MTIPVNPVLQMLANATPRRFPTTSRYATIGTGTFTRPDGTVTSYLLRRFLPQPEVFATLLEHVVIQGERLDNITARYLGDPEQFWRVCDANGAMRPAELTDDVGTTLRITLPEGIAGPTNA